MFRFAAAAFLAVCLFAAAVAPVSAEEARKQVYWKNATLAPEGIGWSKHMKDIIFPEIEKTTNGGVKIKVYWGGVMGDEEDYIRKIRVGQLEGAGLSAQGTFMACPEMSVLELPFLFENYFEVDYLRIKMLPRFDAYMAKNGFFLTGWIDQDFDQIYSIKSPIATVKDFSQNRFITWYGPVEAEMFKLLNVTAIPVNVPELATSVRQGIADAFIGPAVWVVGAQLYSTIKYVNPVKIRYSPATMILTLKAWNDMDVTYRKDFYEKRLELGWRYTCLVRRDNEKYMEALVKNGMSRVDMTPEEIARLKEKTPILHTQFAGRYFSKDLYDEVVAHLKDYRAGKAANHG
jgi:TRAP-type C4-dicarboxylate transport system substrate-binding protein